MENEDAKRQSIKETLKKKIKDKIKKELLEEIYQELKLEEDQLMDELSSSITEETEHAKYTPAPIEQMKGSESITISVKSILKIASHALKYANKHVDQAKWVEVIGLLAGKFDPNTEILNIEDAYPMGHGTAVYAEIKDYKNYVRAFKDIRKNNSFICGWYHSHPSYGKIWEPNRDIRSCGIKPAR